MLKYRKFRSGWQALGDYRFLPLILLLSMSLNLWGNRWGAPNFWHPDEVIKRSITMVEKRSLNPHFFAYGGLHYYTVAAGSLIPVKLYERVFDPHPGRDDKRVYEQWNDRHLARIIQMARTISGVMSTLVVFFTFITATILFDTSVAYLASLLLAVSMPFVAIAHFATVDGAANFWYWLSCLFALLIWRQGHRHWYVLAAITAGFAIGTKIDRLVILFPLVLSHLLRGEGWKIGRLLRFAVLIPIAYVVANPTVVLSLFDFMEGTTTYLFLNSLRGSGDQASFIPILDQMKAGLGLPLFATVLGGLAYGCYKLTCGKDRGAIIWLLGTIVPYFLLIGSASHIAPWYTPMFFPALMMFGGYGCVALFRGLMPHRRIWITIIVTSVVGYSLLNTVAVVRQFSNDSRYHAGDWIRQNVSANSTIAMLPRGPVVSGEKYEIRYMENDKEYYYDHVVKWQEQLAHHGTYQKIYQGIRTFEQWMGRSFGMAVRAERHVPEFVKFVEWYRRGLDGAVDNQAPESDYVVVVEYAQKNTLASLKSTNSGYRLVEEYQFSKGVGIRADFVFVNPRVYIFQRDTQGAGYERWSVRRQDEPSK